MVLCTAYTELVLVTTPVVPNVNLFFVASMLKRIGQWEGEKAAS